MAVYTHRGPNALLEDYAAIARINGVSAVINKALRSQSPDFIELLSYLASNGELTYAQVREGHKPLAWNRYWRYALARILAQQSPGRNQLDLAKSLLSQTLVEFPEYDPPALLQLIAELAVETGDFPHLTDLLAAYPSLREVLADTFMLDLLNPNLNPTVENTQDWQKALNAYLATFDLQPVGFSEPQRICFQGLTSSAAQHPIGNLATDPLVSVVVTCFKPLASTLIHSVSSVLNQTWRNIEVIVVDDASGPECDDTLHAVGELDPRVKVVRQSENRGTYEARNRGFRESSGQFITGHDSDDWSHPQRIERQLAPLLENSSLPGTIAFGLKADDEMRTVRTGVRVVGNCQSTLMIRREIRDLVGDYLPARKAVDTEYFLRVNLLSDVPLQEIAQPLEFVRTDSASLSAADFRPGWKHPARNVIRECYEFWHAQALKSEEPREFLRSTLPFIPTKYQIKPRHLPKFDVVVAGDWQSFGGPQKSMLQEISAHLEAGKRVAVMDVEVDRMMRLKRRGLNSAILELLHAGKVTLILPDEEVEAEVFFLRYPPTLQFVRREPYCLRADRVAILANQAPSERDGSDIRYYPEVVDQNAEFLFGVKPLWIPQGPVVRSQIEDVIPADRVSPIDLPSVVDIADWETDRSYFRSTVPVIGRHSRDDAMKWPGTAEDILAAYPDDPLFEVRVMGGTKYVKRILGEVPKNWTDLKKDAVPVREFLASIEFFVFFPHVRAFESFGMAILEALASGCVVILPEHFEDTFGDAALYCEPEEVRGVVAEYYADPEKYRAQSALAVARVKQEFSLEAHLARFHQLLGV